MNAPQSVAPQQITLPVLQAGEHYAGMIVVDDKPTHHLILLPGDKDGGDWKSAVAWAKEQGGELPTRSEQSLLFANLKSEFKQEWCWSGEQYASGARYAWCQGFSTGAQDYYGKFFELRARAVRRLTIE